MKYPFQGRSLRKGGKSKEKESQASRKEEKDQQLAGSSGSTAKEEARARSLVREAVHASKANITEQEVEEEEAEDDALLTDKKKRKRKPQAKKKSKPQPAGSTAHEAEAAVDDDGFAYSVISFPYDMVSSNSEWCLKGAKEAKTMKALA